MFWHLNIRDDHIKCLRLERIKTFFSQRSEQGTPKRHVFIRHCTQFVSFLTRAQKYQKKSRKNRLFTFREESYVLLLVHLRLNEIAYSSG